MGKVLHGSRSGEPKFYEIGFSESADGDVTLPARLTFRTSQVEYPRNFR